jgi:CBS domain containing-hemolysin-like protein
MSGEEIRTILSASEQEGALDPQLTKMLRGVFDLDEHTARDAMIPRTEVDAVEHTATVADVLSLFKEDLRERYPVYEGSMDNIIGVVSMKQLLNRIASAENAQTASIKELPVREVMMEAYYVPDTMPLSSLLNDFTNNRRQIAIVLDEYGGTEGLITLEDILEEIVGEYEDEFTPRHRHIKKESENSYIINGGVRVTELEPKLNYPFPTGEYVTIGGLINHRLGRIATVGDVVRLEGAQLEVLEMEQHRITKVMFENHVSPEAEGEAESTADAVAQKEFIRSAAKHILSEKPKTASTATRKAGDPEPELQEDTVTDENKPTMSSSMNPGAERPAPIGQG